MMNHQAPPAFRDIVLVGGGHANIHIIKMTGMKPLPGIRVTLITTVMEMPYSGMIPGYVAGLYARDECHMDLGKLCTFGGARLILGEVCLIDGHKKEVTLKDGRPPIRYDILSINVGIHPSMHNLNPDTMSCLTPVKPIFGFANRWDSIMSRVLSDQSDAVKRIAIVGGGAGGTELSFAINYRLKTELKAIGRDPSLVNIVLVTRGSTILAEHNRQMQHTALRLMSERGIQVLFGCEALSINYNPDGYHQIVCSDGKKIDFFEAIWCTQAEAPSWLKDCKGLELNNGFVAVLPTLQSVSCPDIFAVGDVCCMVKSPRPKAGVFAVRAGPPLLENMKNKLYGYPLCDWTPQSQFLSILGVAPNYAFASRGPICIEGANIWKLKDKIDRDWLAGYQKLVPMGMSSSLSRSGDSSSTLNSLDADPLYNLSPEVHQVLSHQSMRCGGCGSKVGAQVLQRALRRLAGHLRAGARPEVVSGIGGVTPGDDAALIRAPEAPCYLVQTIDYFRSFIRDPYVFGQIAATHALSDIFAMNAEPVSAMALCVIPYGPEDKVEDTLVQMLAGTCQVLKTENCTLVGGHTAEGAEDALGLSCHGVVHPDRVLPKGPVESGCSLILTKPIGTGVILAADMKGAVSGRCVAEAIRNMLISNRAAARILYENGCKACTDVTGFGVLGHLLEMIKYGDANAALGQSDASETTGVRLNLSAIPVLSGALDCVSRGIQSTLHPQNVRCARAVHNPELGATDPVYSLLFDPQTSGGLLACVPSEVASQVVSELQKAQYPAAAIIGQFFTTPRSRVGSGAYLTDDLLKYGVSSGLNDPLSTMTDKELESCPIDESEILVWLDK